MKKITEIFFCFLLFSCSSEKEEVCSCNYPNRTNTYVKGISEFNKLEPGIECAEECSKPIFLSFVAPICASNRKMERQIFTKEVVFNNLKENFVIVNLYVDDKSKLPKDEMYESELNGRTKLIETIGDRNADLQAKKFNGATQPQYIILSPFNQSIIAEFGYLPNSKKVDSILTSALINNNF